MGALPKNKITRAERGKRRLGNTPTLTRDPKQASVPLARRGIAAQFLRLFQQNTNSSSASKKATK